MEKPFRLYTWHLPDWDITKEKHDPCKGRKKWGDEWDVLQQLYPELYKRVGTSDFVWCYTKYEYWLQEINKLWVLDVPSLKIDHFLDSGIWNTMRQDVENNEQPKEASWDKLFVERNEGIEEISAGNNKDITALVCVPLCTSIQVIDKRFSVGSLYLNPRYQKRYEDLPTSENKAKIEMRDVKERLGVNDERT